MRTAFLCGFLILASKIAESTSLNSNFGLSDAMISTFSLSISDFTALIAGTFK